LVYSFSRKGPSINTSAVRGKGGFVHCGHFSDKGGRGSLDVDVHTFSSKIFGFFVIDGLSTRTRGVEPVQTFFGQGGSGQIFAILCKRLLWMAPKRNINYPVDYLTAFSHHFRPFKMYYVIFKDKLNYR